MKHVFLTIDCGTQSLRALLFSDCGTLMSMEKIDYQPYTSPNAGWAEQDADVLWDSLCIVCKKLKHDDAELFNRIEGVGITTQRDSMINVDENGNVLRPVITWLDQRKADTGRNAVLTTLNSALKLAGQGDFLTRLARDGKSNWIRMNQPDIWDNTFKYLQISGFLNFKLTGFFKDSVASQIGHIPFDYKKKRWAGRFSPTSLLYPIENNKLPELIEPGEILGRITKKASRATGIRKDTPVVACGSDKGCETIGMGVVGRQMASLSFGTTATVQVTTDRYFEPNRFMPSYPAPYPGFYNPEVEIFRGYWMITWFKNEFAHKEIETAEAKGVAVEVELDRLLRKSPPGSMGLVVQPFWSPGLMHPVAKGCMIGFGDVHTRSHVYRAVIEGLGFALYDGFQTLERRGGLNMNRVCVSGGASQSDEICKITANIFNLPMLRGRTAETSGLGAAVVTASGTGVYGSIQESIKNMVHVESEFKPDPECVGVYKKLYKQVYQKIYKTLKPLYQGIQDITGYPEK